MEKGRELFIKKVLLSRKRDDQPLPKISNKRKIDRVFVYGTPYEDDFVKEGVRKYDNSIEVRRIEKKEEMPAFLSGSANSIVIADVGDTRGVDFGLVAKIAKENNSYFALLTSENACLPSPNSLSIYLKEKGQDPQLAQYVDYVFQYTGTTTLVEAMLALHEDRINFSEDKEKVILVVEDKANYYSAFLEKLYKINNGRARVLLARDFETANFYIDSVNDRLIGAILDMTFPKNNTLSEDAVFEIYSRIKKIHVCIPIIFYSFDIEKIKMVENSALGFGLWKGDKALVYKLSSLINDFFGFGDFIFRLPPPVNKEIARASTLAEFISQVVCLSPEILSYHGAHNHFSNWLWLHGFKKMAEELRVLTTTDGEEIRSHILNFYLKMIKEATQDK